MLKLSGCASQRLAEQFFDYANNSFSCCSDFVSVFHARLLVAVLILLRAAHLAGLLRTLLALLPLILLALVTLLALLTLALLLLILLALLALLILARAVGLALLAIHEHLQLMRKCVLKSGPLR